MLKAGSLPQHLFQYSVVKTYIVVLLVVVVASTLLCRNTDAWMMVVTPFQSTSRQFILNDNSLLTSTLVTTAKSKRTMYHPTKYRNQRTYFMTPSEHPEDTTTTTDRAALNNSNININNLNELSPTEFILATENMDPTTRAVVEAAKKKQQQMALITENGGVPSNKYPIDAPSPVLLATSMILAIISTGSLFQLLGITSTNPNPTDVSTTAASSSFELGLIPTAVIVLIGAPLSIYMLYAAITKATAETEEDDQAFLSGK